MKISILLASAAVLCGSCIKENFPTNSVTQDQVDKNPNSMEYLVNGMNVWLGQAFTMDDDRFHYDFGYPGLCIAMDRMGQTSSIRTTITTTSSRRGRRSPIWIPTVINPTFFGTSITR